MAQTSSTPTAASSDGIAQVSSMPLPPMQFIMEYSDEAVKHGTAPQPPLPILDSYSMFGQPFSSEDCIVASLESQGIRRLYSAKEVDRKRELRKLNHSILVNFLDLIDILIKTPDSAKREEKIEDLNLLFIHMHHLINEFRPHQARETLRVMLHVQKRKRCQVAEKFREHLDKVQDLIQEALDALPAAEDQNFSSNMSNSEQQEFREPGSTSTFGSQSGSGISPIDLALCQLVDAEISKT